MKFNKSEKPLKFGNDTLGEYKHFEPGSSALPQNCFGSVERVADLNYRSFGLVRTVRVANAMITL